MKKALITGITGQDGSYLAELCYNTAIRCMASCGAPLPLTQDRIDHIYADPQGIAPLQLHYGDLANAACLRRLMEEIEPDEVYNLAAQSHVRDSFDQAEYTADIVSIGALRMLEAFRDYVLGSRKQPRFYQAGSSEMFGRAAPPQNEETKFYPRSPYAVAKVAAHSFAINFREAYGLFISNGILFNHESPRRGETFVTRKITRALGRIRFGFQDKLYLGNLDARRDWGHAADYVRAMWLMLQHHEPDDFVVATGRSYSVRDFLELAASYAGVDWTAHVEIDPRYLRPTEVDFLQGDASKIRRTLGWESSVDFEDLVCSMVENDLELARQEQTLIRGGHKVVQRAAAAYA